MGTPMVKIINDEIFHGKVTSPFNSVIFMGKKKLVKRNVLRVLPNRYKLFLKKAIFMENFSFVLRSLSE